MSLLCDAIPRVVPTPGIAAGYTAAICRTSKNELPRHAAGRIVAYARIRVRTHA
ncbi:hypothetical protein [Streptomyces sp. NPDC051546]|uniref:hypothetical protein n=1 Tax=Streptomyces sp. NPDC051546 TaxID=3365655 RepID=UPI003798EFF7